MLKMGFQTMQYCWVSQATIFWCKTKALLLLPLPLLLYPGTRLLWTSCRTGRAPPAPPPSPVPGQQAFCRSLELVWNPSLEEKKGQGEDPWKGLATREANSQDNVRMVREAVDDGVLVWGECVDTRLLHGYWGFHAGEVTAAEESKDWSLGGRAHQQKHVGGCNHPTLC